MHTAMYSIHSNSMQSCSNHICSSTCGLSVRLSFPQISSLISSWGSCVVSCLLMVWAAELHVALVSDGSARANTGHRGGRQVFCTHRPRARAGGTLTHRCYSTITLLLQRHTLLRESSWEMSSSCLSSLVHISCGDGQKEQKRSERMTNASASTSTNRPSVGELKLDRDDFWRKSEQYLFVFINAKLAVVGGFSVLLCSCSGVLGGC